MRVPCRELGRAVLLMLLAFGGCRREQGPQPLAPEPEPAPAQVPDVEPTPPPTVAAPTLDSWSALLRFVPPTGFVAGADVLKLRQNAIWSEQIDVLPKRAGTKFEKFTAVGTACGFSLRDMRRIVIAGDFEGSSTPLVAVEAPGVGDRALLDCVAAQQQPPAQWIGSSLVLGDSKVHLMPQSADVVVVVDEKMVARVDEIVATGRAEPDPELATLLERADLGAGAWVVGVVPQTSTSSPKVTVRHFAVTLDTTVGLGVAAWLGTDPGQADALRGELQTTFDGAKSSLSTFGVPVGVVNSVSFNAVGDGVVIQMRANDADLRTTISTFEKL